MTAAPRLIAQAEKILDNLQICPARPAQTAVAASLDDTRAWREGVRRDLAARGEACREAINQAPGWRLASLGAYFAFVEHPFRGRDAAAVAERLARAAGVLGLPGSYFGSGLEGYLRLAFANVGVDILAGLSTRLRAISS